MKKLNLKSKFMFFTILSFGLIFTVTNCKKDTEFIKNRISVKNDKIDIQDQKIEKIRSDALIFSQNHNKLVNQILQLTKSKELEKHRSLTQDEYFDVIKEVTGVKPVILTKENNMFFYKHKNMLNLDVNQLKLSDYVNTVMAKKYLGQIDSLMVRENVDLSEMITLINKIQLNAENDSNINLIDLKKVITATEVLKGSLLLWSNQFIHEENISRGKKWSKWKKWSFIAAADAIGAVIGFYAGAYIVWGITLYIPAGPWGAVGGAAIFSAVAAQYVKYHH